MTTARIDSIGLTIPAATRDIILSNANWNIESKRVTNTTQVGQGPLAQNRDFHITAMAEQEFDAVRLILLSCDAANTVQAATASVAPSANMTSVNTPTGSWTTFTWSGAGSVNIPVGAAAAFTATASDWMSVQSVARDDGGRLPIFMLRIHFPVGPGTYVYTADASSAITFDTDALTNGHRWYRIFQNNIDSVTTPASFTNTGEGNTFPACVIQFRSRGRVLTCQFSGDSITGGSKSTGGVLSGGFLACAFMSSADYPISYLGGGWASQTSTQYLANGKTLLTNATPHVAFYSVFSPNDTTFNQAMVNSEIQRAMDFTISARAAGAVPVLLTPTPDATDNATSTALKVALTTSLLALRSRGFLVGDVYTLVTDQTKRNATGGYSPKSGWWDADGIHPNDVGYGQISDNVIKPILAQIIAANSSVLA